jgi:hypothetical protein
MKKKQKPVYFGAFDRTLWGDSGFADREDQQADDRPDDSIMATGDLWDHDRIP